MKKKTKKMKSTIIYVYVVACIQIKKEMKTQTYYKKNHHHHHPTNFNRQT